MTKAPQYVLTGEQAIQLKDILQTMHEDVSFIEKATGKILIEADREKCEPLIHFCHDIFQALRLIPIYVRNIEKMTTLGITGDLNAYAEKTNTLLYGLLSISEQSFSVENKEDPENLHVILVKLISRDDYLNLDVATEVTAIKIVAIKLDQTFLKLKEILS